MKNIIQYMLIYVIIFLILISCSQPTETATIEQQKEYEYCWQLLDIYFIFRNQLPRAEDYHKPAALFNAANEPYTNYYPKDEAQRVLDMLNTENAGIGIIIDSTTTGYMISYVVPESPAGRAGLMENDTIVAVDDILIRGMAYDALEPLLNGAIGDNKKLTVHRPEAGEIHVQLTIASFFEPSVIVDSLESDVAYIYLNTFLSETGVPGGSAEEFRTALIQTQWADYTILDLSFNSGGELNQCVQITSEFFHEDTPLIVSQKRVYQISDSSGITIEDTIRASFNGNAIDRKFIVIFNKQSASATELLISALRCQRKDIVLIGETTYGKARGQIYHSTPMDALATVTFSLFRPLDGVLYDLSGIDPDIFLEDNENGVALALGQIESGLAKLPYVRYKIRKIMTLRQHQSRKPVLDLFDRIQ